MANPQGVTQKAVALAVGGRKQTIVARLNLLAVRVWQQTSCGGRIAGCVPVRLFP